MTDYLVITALGADHPGVVNDLSATIHESGCNIDDSRMMVLGGEFAIILMLSGEAKAVDQLIKATGQIEKKTGLNVISKRTYPRSTPNVLPYSIEIVSMDEPGIVHHVTEFFALKKINIQSLETDSYAAAHTGTPMFSMKMTIEIPDGTSISEIKKAFNQLCEEYNLDCSLKLHS